MKIHSSELREYPDGLKEFPDKYLSEDHAYKVHGQTLNRLNERGGMGYFEIWINLNKLPIRDYEKNKNYCKAVMYQLIKLENEG